VWVVPPLLLWWWFKVTPGKSSSSSLSFRSFARWLWLARRPNELAQVVSAPPHLPLACMTTLPLLLLLRGERQRKISHNNLPACWESVDVYYYKRALHLSLSLWTHYFYYLSCVCVCVSWFPLLWCAAQTAQKYNAFYVFTFTAPAGWDLTTRDPSASGWMQCEETPLRPRHYHDQENETRDFRVASEEIVSRRVVERRWLHSPIV
jgi:hypothetical protein